MNKKDTIYNNIMKGINNIEQKKSLFSQIEDAFKFYIDFLKQAFSPRKVAVFICLISLGIATSQLDVFNQTEYYEESYAYSLYDAQTYLN